MEAKASHRALEEPFELLLFGVELEDDPLARRLLAADPAFTAWLVARLAREPVLLH